MSNNLPADPVRPLPSKLPSFYEGNLSFEAAPTHHEKEVQLREYFKIVVKYRMVLMACVILTVILGAIYAFTATPLYMASAKIRINTYQPILSAAKIEDMLQERSKETNYFETQVQEMYSYSLADQVLQDEDLRQRLTPKSGPQGFFGKVFGGSGNTGPDALDAEVASENLGYKSSIREIKSYLSMLEIQPVRRTSLVIVNATTKNPALSAVVANKHALTYIDWVRETRIENQSRGLKFLTQQSQELREKVITLERELADYAEANSIVALNKDENITAQKMSQLNQLLTQAIAKRIEADNMYKEADTALASGSAGFDDSTTQSMRTEYARLQGEYNQLRAKFTDNYPKIQQLKSQLEAVRQSIEGQRKHVVLGLKAKALAAQEEEKNLLEELEQQKSQTFELSKRQVQYNVLNRELTSSRELLENVLKEIKETSLAVESNASNISVVDYAVVPESPRYPRKSLIIFISAMVGLCLGLGLAFLLNYLDNSVRTPEQLSALINLPTLGVVPSFSLEMLDYQEGTAATDETHALVKSEDGHYMPGPVVFINNPKSLASEAYRTIRTGILLSQAGEPPKTILLSSAQSSEGKTTTCINLAASLASAGGRVVIIDADLRRPSVHKHFGQRGIVPGVVEVITGQMSLEDVTQADLIKRVSIIPAGRIPPNPAELLGSVEMASLIDRLAFEYDYVLIDSPPVLPVTDAVILSRYVDGVVLVVRGAATPKKVVKDAKEKLSSVGAKFLGAILNDVDVTGGDYYYYNRYYYSYYKREGELKSSAA